ncbi:uncharacterized protein LOC100570428 isoform X2 [Acyrthosiphon pisum]|uniref:Uncharacterized protein n=1 Tax=Acyrthosiphon pisum TaxID=7029 RepID=A0A8R2ABM7_ACYPI|nr:uncharacterized protein LOC100570428 isoform X2 [Acyrthosiphon pisum]|eukprot:XP_003245437.2 PREDICTED: uncharacterized protein LOC100570428 [Acyrthosiphon pisum]
MQLYTRKPLHIYHQHRLQSSSIRIDSTNYTFNFVKRDDHLITSSQKLDINFISQLKMLAFTQLAEHSIQRWNRENMSPELFDGNVEIISPTSPPNIKTDNTSDTQNEEEDIFKAKSYDSIQDILQSFDVNDGPDFFKTQPTPLHHQSTYATFPKPLHRIKKICYASIEIDEHRRTVLEIHGEHKNHFQLTDLEIEKHEVSPNKNYKLIGDLTRFI